MRINSNEIEKLPELIKEQIKRKLSETNSHSSVSSCNLEQAIGNEQVGAQEIPRLHTPCYITMHSIRKGKPDFDGVSGKAVIDGLVNIGVLQDDRQEQISRSPVYTFEKGKKEVTIITLTSEEK